ARPSLGARARLAERRPRAAPCGRVGGGGARLLLARAAQARRLPPAAPAGARAGDRLVDRRGGRGGAARGGLGGGRARARRRGRRGSARAPRQRRGDPLHLPRGPERPRAGPGGGAPARRRAGRLLHPRPGPLARVEGARGLGGGAREPAPLLHPPPRSGAGAAPKMTALALGPAVGQTRPMRATIAAEEPRAALAVEAVPPLPSLSAFFPAR